VPEYQLIGTNDTTPDLVAKVTGKAYGGTWTHEALTAHV
jgi:hypothetical protein